jgi:hypothetical protein
MSPALLTKYLQAARTSPITCSSTPNGFEFAPHPMLVETDREKYCIQQIVDFYDRQPTDYSDYFRARGCTSTRGVSASPGDARRHRGAEQVSARYLATIWQALETKEDVGPLAKLQTMWRALPAPKANQPISRAISVDQMRDFVVRMRKDTQLKFASPS